MKLRYALLTSLSLIAASAASAQQPKVLAEMFRNVNCGNCRTPDDHYETFLKANPDLGIEVIYYHNLITNQQDPFYLASKADVDQRSNTFYVIGANPAAVIDGAPAGSLEGNWETYTKAAAAQSGSFPAQINNLVVSAGSGNTYNLTFTVSGTGGQNARAYVALKESHIVYQNTWDYGNPSSGFWDDIFRQMLPSKTGSEVFSGAKSFTVTFDAAAHPDWNPANMEAVIFVQADQATQGVRPVLGLAAVSLATSGVVDGVTHAVSQIRASGASLRVTLTDAARVRIEMVDMLGRQVNTAVEAIMPKGETSVETGGLSPGTYIARMIVDGKVAGQTKFVSLP